MVQGYFGSPDAGASLNGERSIIKDINGVKRVHNHISVMKEIPKITRR